MEVPKLMVLLAILGLIHTTTSLKVSKKSHTLPRNCLWNFDREDGQLLYVAYGPGYNLHEKICRVIGERNVERPDTYVCNVTLTTLKQHETIIPEVSVQRFGQNKAILFWQVNERLFLGLLYSVITVVQLETCKIGEIRLDYKSARDKVFFIPNGDTVEVFFKHSKLCDKDMCRMIIDGSGKLIQSPTAFFKDHEEPYLLRSISGNSSKKGYFYVKQTNNETFFVLINHNGWQKLLSRLVGQPKIYTSTIHDCITACATYDGDKKYINCTQYDANGHFKFKTQLKKATVDTQVKFVHNVREGGFFLAYFVPSSCRTFLPCIRNLKNLLAKFDTGGKHVGNKVERKSSYVWNSMFENKAGDYCVFKSSIFGDNYVKKGGKSRMRITHDCYNNKDFSRLFHN